MFGSARSEELEQLVEALARSYLRGSAHGTPEGRSKLAGDMAALAGRLRAAGKDKAVERARKFRPGFFPGFPAELRADFKRQVDSALE
ncbi:hypothetical protein [Kribbella sp. NPDC051718]|uniref:hypothetical protein n=1 Tax=Kribbella sp. NPDC051718 TaxID=3155168 RepID=UPI003413CF33